MADEPENHTLHLLREMRDGLEQAGRERQEMRGQLDRIEVAVVGMSYLTGAPAE